MTSHPEIPAEMREKAYHVARQAGCVLAVGAIDTIAAFALQVRNEAIAEEREGCARDCERYVMATGYSGTKPTHGRYVLSDAVDEFHQGSGYAALIRARP